MVSFSCDTLQKGDNKAIIIIIIIIIIEFLTSQLWVGNISFVIVTSELLQ